METIERVLKDKYGDVILKKLTGGYSNEVFLLEGTNPRLIAKCSNIFNNDCLTEIRSLQLLENGSVFPKFLDYFESGSSRVIMMDFKYGVNGQSILDQGNISKSLKLYELLGEYLAKEIHSIKFSIEVQYLPVYKKNMGDLDQLKFIPRSLISEVEHMLSDENEENLVLIHGDYGSHNSIVDDELLYIIDWEWAGWGSPLQDISWIIWFLKFHYPHISEELSQIFIKSYRDYSEFKFSSDTLKQYAVSRVMNIMQRIKNSNEKVKEEWIKRLSWTLSSDFTI